jgi:hypothetical protein
MVSAVAQHDVQVVNCLCISALQIRRQSSEGCRMSNADVCLGKRKVEVCQAGSWQAEETLR